MSRLTKLVALIAELGVLHLTKLVALIAESLAKFCYVASFISVTRLIKKYERQHAAQKGRVFLNGSVEKKTLINGSDADPTRKRAAK